MAATTTHASCDCSKCGKADNGNGQARSCLCTSCSPSHHTAACDCVRCDPEYTVDVEVKHEDGDIVRVRRRKDEEMDGISQWSNWRPACTLCYLDDDDVVVAAFPDAEGAKDRLCAGHAKRRRTFICKSPCEKCAQIGVQKRGTYPNKAGRKRALCAEHARDDDTWQTLYPCEECVAQQMQPPTAATFPNARGQINKLCSLHSRKAGTHRVHHPCQGCIRAGATPVISAAFPNAFGLPNQLCKAHAIEIGIYTLSRPCEQCIADGVDTPVSAGFADEHGRTNKLCSVHAKAAGSYIMMTPCVVCVEENADPIMSGTYADDTGSKKLCTKHAKQAGRWHQLHPCEACVEEKADNILEASFRNAKGEALRLCSRHARVAGSYVMAYPCEECLAQGMSPISAGYENKAGEHYKLCARHAQAAGTLVTPVRGFSRAACEAFDRVERAMSLQIEHVHYVLETSDRLGSERCIPTTRLHPDGWQINSGDTIIWEFLGSLYHGFPPTHPRYEDESPLFPTNKTAKELHDSSMERFALIHAMGYTIRYIWEHQWKEVNRVRCPRPIAEIVHTYAPDVVPATLQTARRLSLM